MLCRRRKLPCTMRSMVFSSSQCGATWLQKIQLVAITVSKSEMIKAPPEMIATDFLLGHELILSNTLEATT